MYYLVHMQRVQKRTPVKRKARVAAHQPPKDPFAVAFGDRLTECLREKRDERGQPWSNSRLARELQETRGLESAPTRTVGLWKRGERLPAADQLADLARILGVQIDWLLCGEGPVWRKDKRPPSEWSEDFANMIRRAAFDHVRAAHPRFADLRIEHLAVNVSAMLKRVSANIAARFLRDVKRELQSEAKDQTVAMQSEILTAFVHQLPLGRSRSDADSAMRTLASNDVHVMQLNWNDDRVNLTYEGAVALGRSRLLPGAVEAKRELLEIAKRAR